MDANSPAFLKHRQEEAARNNAKRLAAEQLAAPNARAAATKTLTTSSERAASAAVVARHAPIDSPESTPENGLSKIDSDAANTAMPIEIDTTQPVAAAIASEGTTIEVKPAARRVIAEVLDEASLARREAEQAAVEAKRNRKSPDDYAPFASRVAAGAIDLIAIGFLSSPLAAALELGYGDWSGTGIRLIMVLGIALIVFLYFTASVAFAGRTWGMSMLSLRAVDVETGMIPTVHQAARRGAAYVASLAFLGLGFLYALIDPEGRGAHDHLSGTVVIHD